MYAAGRFKHLFQYSIPTVLIFLIQKRSCSYVARMIMKYVQYDVWHVVDPKQKKNWAPVSQYRKYNMMAIPHF